MGSLMPTLIDRHADREPPWQEVKALVLNSLSSRHSRRAYEAALDEFALWLYSQDKRPFDKSAVLQYRSDLEMSGLQPSSVNVRLSAIRRLATEAAGAGLLSTQTATAILRVHGPKRLGRRIGNWLTREQSTALLSQPDIRSLIGKRDRAILSVLIGTGLRRAELVSLTFGHLQLRSERWAIVDLAGKGGRVRTVPIPNWVKDAIDEWTSAAKQSAGAVFRRVYKDGRVSHKALSAQAILRAVQIYGRRLGLIITPHDLRRTYATLAYNGRAPLEQIQFSLGHASTSTTEVYLGVRQDLRNAPCDCLQLSWPPERVDADRTAPV